MNRRYLWAAAAVLLFTSAARADVPLPPHLKYVDPRVAFEGVEKHPDYVFCLRFLTFVGGPSGVPHRLVVVHDAKPFALDADRRLIDMKLLAVDRGEFEKRSKDSPSTDCLTDKTEGVLVAPVIPPSTTGSKLVSEAPLTRYRVELKDGKLSVERVAVEKGTGPFGLLPSWMAGLFLAAAVALGGYLIIRRMRWPAPAGVPLPAAD